jgi:hypothetical protein
VVQTPGVPVGDMRLDVMLDELARRRSIVPGKVRTIAGHRCTVLQTKEPIGGSTVEPPTRRNHADACVERHGIVLEERWWLDGKLTRIRTAEALDTSPTFAADEFTVTGEPIAPKGGGNAIVPMVEPDADLPSIDVPASFGSPQRFRYLVGTPPRDGVPQIPPVRALQVWVDGSDFLVLETGQDAESSSLPTSMGAVTVDGLEDAGLNVTVYGSEVFGHLDQVTIFRLRGSVSPGRLLAIARTLRR